MRSSSGRRSVTLAPSRFGDFAPLISSRSRPSPAPLVVAGSMIASEATSTSATVSSGAAVISASAPRCSAEPSRTAGEQPLRDGDPGEQAASGAPPARVACTREVNSRFRRSVTAIVASASTAEEDPAAVRRPDRAPDRAAPAPASRRRRSPARSGGTATTRAPARAGVGRDRRRVPGRRRQRTEVLRQRGAES